MEFPSSAGGARSVVWQGLKCSKVCNSYSAALTAPEDFISQLLSSFRRHCTTELPVNTETFRRLILCHFNSIAAYWKTAIKTGLSEEQKCASRPVLQRGDELLAERLSIFATKLP